MKKDRYFNLRLKLDGSMAGSDVMDMGYFTNALFDVGVSLTIPDWSLESVEEVGTDCDDMARVKRLPGGQVGKWTDPSFLEGLEAETGLTQIDICLVIFELEKMDHISLAKPKSPRGSNE